MTMNQGCRQWTGLTGTGPPTLMKAPPSLLYKYNCTIIQIVNNNLFLAQLENYYNISNNKNK